MPRKRSLKDTVKDPLVEKPGKNVTTTKKRKSSGKRIVFAIVLSLIVGFAGGVAYGKLIRFL